MAGALGSLHRIAAQLALFVVALRMIRNGRDARNAIFAFLAGLVPAIIYGLYQSTIPVGAATLPQWSEAPIAWDTTTGTAHIRVFSTFDHSLRFSHALSIGFGFAIGLMGQRVGSRARVFLAVLAAAAVLCNQFTYSVGGTVAVASALGGWAILNRRRRVTWLLPVVVVVWVALAPSALFNRLTQVFTGQSTSAMARIITYHQSFQVLRDHPLLGVGWGGIGGALEFEYRISKAKNIAFTAENMFLQRGLALGIPGMLLTIAIALRFLRNTTRFSSRALAEGDVPWPRGALLIGGAAFYAQGMVIPVGNETSNFLLWVLLAIAEAGSRAAAEGESP